MNKADRARLGLIRSELERLKGEVESIGSEIRDLADAEQEKFDNMSEGLQQGEQGQAIEAAAGELDEIASAAEDGNLSEALEAFDNLEI
jgi:hypothetical protein